MVFGLVFKGLKVRALYDYQARREDELSFFREDVISNVLKEYDGWWRGDLGTRRQLWFPSNYVVELEEDYNEEDEENECSEATPLGSLQKGSVEMMGAYVEHAENDSDPNIPFVIKIYSDSNSTPFSVAVKGEAEFKVWFDAIKEAAQNASDRVRT